MIYRWFESSGKPRGVKLYFRFVYIYEVKLLKGNKRSYL